MKTVNQTKDKFLYQILDNLSYNWNLKLSYITENLRFLRSSRFVYIIPGRSYCPNVVQCFENNIRNMKFMLLMNIVYKIVTVETSSVAHTRARAILH